MATSLLVMGPIQLIAKSSMALALYELDRSHDLLDLARSQQRSEWNRIHQLLWTKQRWSYPGPGKQIGLFPLVREMKCGSPIYAKQNGVNSLAGGQWGWSLVPESGFALNKRISDLSPKKTIGCRWWTRSRSEILVCISWSFIFKYWPSTFAFFPIEICIPFRFIRSSWLKIICPGSVTWLTSCTCLYWPYDSTAIGNGVEQFSDLQAHPHIWLTCHFLSRYLLPLIPTIYLLLENGDSLTREIPWLLL